MNATTLGAYLSGDLDPRTRTALDSHVVTCLPCAQTLAEAAGRDIVWIRRGPLGRLVRVRLN